MNGVQKRHAIDRSGDDALARVPDRGKAGRLVTQLHHRAAVDGARAVGVGDVHPFHEDGARFARPKRRSVLSHHRVGVAWRASLTWGRDSRQPASEMKPPTTAPYPTWATR